MKNFLWITIVGFVLAVLAANGAPKPLASPAAAPAKAECNCSNLKALQIELHNAVRLQQAFQGKIADLRKLDREPSTAEFKKFADAAANGLTRPAGDTGPETVEYTPYGNSVDTGILEAEKKTKKTPKEIEERRVQLCGLSTAAKLEIEAMERGASCAGIAAAVKAHEGVHWASCLRSGYVAFRDMHGANRAQEEVEAYGAQIKVLRDILDSLRCGYRATGQTADLVYSGVICSLEKPFTVNGTNAAIKYVFEFVPSSATSGTVTHSGMGSMVTAAGGGPYTIEGANTDKPRIALAQSGVGRSPVGSRNYSGTVYIDLVPLETDECNKP